MMQNEKVQNWVNSLPVEHGEDIHENNAVEDGLLLHSSNNNRAADDMSLGAEAKSVMLTGNGRRVSHPEGLDNDSEMTNGTVQPEAKFNFIGRACNGGGDAAVQLLRQRFRIQQQDSFNSESSSHLTIDSIDQLLWERRGDPEKILENLGFVGKVIDRRQRVPERYLKSSSQANGISVEKFLEKNPWLKEYLEQKAALRKPFEAITQNVNHESIEETTEIEPEVKNVTKKKMTAFHQVASTITMINRFRNLVKRLNEKEPGLEPLVEPILRNSTKGTKYWSILSLDNYNFLDQMGYYDMRLEKPSKSGRSRFSLAASNLVKQMTGNGLMNVVNSQPDNERCPKQSEKLDTILSSRATTEQVKEKVPEMVESPLIKDSRFSVPERFLTSQSLLFGPVQQLTGECVSELVCKGGDGSFDLSNAPDLCFPSSNDVALTDLNANTIEELPTFAIESSHDSASSKSNDVESFDYEWQRTSASSTGTEDSSFSDSEERAIFFNDCQKNPRMDFLGLTVDEVGRGLLRVPSDAASNLSSHTLLELENVDHSSDQDTDTLQMSQDSLSMRRNDVVVDQFNSSEESTDQGINIHDISSQLNKKKDLSSDHLPPVLNLSSKIRGVLRRQGSSQSDSSGFVDSDHLDSSLLPDSYFPNKVRYMNRQMKLDTISSQDSNSPEEDSNFSSQSDFFHSPLSVFSPSANQNFDGSSQNRIRILKGDYRNEFWSSKRSVEIQTGWDSFHNCADDPVYLPHGLIADSGTLMKEKFHSQPELYTSRLYIDSRLPRTSVPLVERAEVMLLLGGTSRGEADYEDSRLPPAFHVSSVDVDVIKTEDGNRFLTPILFSSGKMATEKNQTLADERDLSRHKRRIVEFDLADKNTFEGAVSVQKNVFDLSKVNAKRRKSLPLDFSDHQILHSYLKQSVFVSPQCAASLLPPSHWSTFGDAEIGQKQYLLEEVKLLQNALQKYRLEVRVLQMEAKKLYMNENSYLLPEDRNSLLAMDELHEAVSKELDSLDTQLSQRMKLVISSSPHELSLDVDLSCLSIIKQMTELLKEQTYHGNLINGLSMLLPSCSQSESGVASYVRNPGEDLLLDKIASLEEKMEEQSKAFERCLTNAVHQMQELMQHQRQITMTEASTSNRSSFDKTRLL